jgi:prevent-host-death family protein
MEIITSAEFQRRVGEYQDRALVEPILVTRNGRERLVLLAVSEYNRLKRLDRETLSAADLSEHDLALIADATPPAESANFDHEVDN